MRPDAGSARQPWVREWLTDSGLFLVSQVGVIVATATLAILVARGLGPAEWGIFSAFLGLSLALSILAEFGLGTWLLREFSELATVDEVGKGEAQAQSGRLMSGGLLLSGGFGGALIIATALAAALVAIDLRLSTALVALVAYGSLLGGSVAVEAFFRARRKVGRVVAAIFLEKALLLVLVAAALLAGFGLLSVALAYPIAALARLAFSVLNVLLRDELVLTRPRLWDAREIFVRSFPFAANRAALNVVPRLDVLLLAILSPVAAGYFALGDRIVGPALIAPVVLSTTLYPFLAREPDDSRAGVRIIALLTLSGIGLAAVAAAAAPAAVPLVFGQEYRAAVPTVQVMMLVIPFIFASNPLLVHVYSRRREGRALTSSLALVSVAGTAAIVAGQLVAGPIAAGGGYVLRQAGFVACLLAAGFLFGRGSAAAAGGDALAAELSTAPRSAA